MAPEFDPPSIWKRFMTRAQYVSGRRDFQKQFEVERERWNANHPLAPITVPAQHIPKDGWLRPRRSIRYPYPPAIEALMARPGWPDNETAAERQISLGLGDWDLLVRRLVAEWWPEPYYVHWRAPWDDPVQPFVAACLRWKISDVDAVTSIGDAPQSIVETEFDLFDITANPSWNYASTYGDELREALWDEVFSGSITHAWAMHLLNRAAARVRKARDATPTDGRFVYVQVFPGMRETDWKSLWEQLLRRGLGRDDLRRWVAELHREGKPTKTIADLLGMPRTTVQGMIDNA
jgi:hypothetical protein